MKTLILCILSLSLISAKAVSQAPSHAKFDAVLKEFVSEDGQVSYGKLANDRTEFDAYIKMLESNHPDNSWTKDAQLAFWINAYNAFTIKLIIDNYPVKSIKELGGKIYKVNTAWDIRFVNIGDETYDLNNIEHAIIRKQFNEPRIHFAINCASESCPNLRNEAYTAAKLDAQLEEQTKKFINDKSKNKITNSSAQLSKIFSWFKGDFTKGGKSLIEFINRYADVKIDAKADISHLDYSWELNGV